MRRSRASTEAVSQPTRRPRRRAAIERCGDRRRRRWGGRPGGHGRDGRGGEDGSASIEFVVAGLVLLVPIVYVIVALGVVQSHALGVQATARHVARAVATAPDTQTADRRAELLGRSIADEYGIDPDQLEIVVSCTVQAACPAAGATLEVRVSAEAPLPLVPPVLGLDQFARVPVEAQSVQRISRLAGVS